MLSWDTWSAGKAALAADLILGLAALAANKNKLNSLGYYSGTDWGKRHPQQRMVPTALSFVMYRRLIEALCFLHAVQEFLAAQPDNLITTLKFDFAYCSAAQVAKWGMH